jgi:hypothetical protein
MGATKVNFKHVRAIQTKDVQVESFELLKNQRCKILTTDSLRKGDTILIKASFLNACIGQDEYGNPDEDNILYRRRVVPFVAKINDCKEAKNQRNRLGLSIENISDADCRYLYKKMKKGSKKNESMLEIEAKKITFAI